MGVILARTLAMLRHTQLLLSLAACGSPTHESAPRTAAPSRPVALAPRTATAVPPRDAEDSDRVLSECVRRWNPQGSVRTLEHTDILCSTLYRRPACAKAWLEFSMEYTRPMTATEPLDLRPQMTAMVEACRAEYCTGTSPTMCTPNATLTRESYDEFVKFLLDQELTIADEHKWKWARGPYFPGFRSASGDADERLTKDELKAASDAAVAALPKIDPKVTSCKSMPTATTKEKVAVGTCFRQAGALGAAIIYWNKARLGQLDEATMEAARQLGPAYEAAGQFERAAEAYDYVVSEYPSSSLGPHLDAATEREIQTRAMCMSRQLGLDKLARRNQISLERFGRGKPIDAAAVCTALRPIRVPKT